MTIMHRAWNLVTYPAVLVALATLWAVMVVDEWLAEKAREG